MIKESSNYLSYIGSETDSYFHLCLAYTEISHLYDVIDDVIRKGVSAELHGLLLISFVYKDESPDSYVLNVLSGQF